LTPAQSTSAVSESLAILVFMEWECAGHGKVLNKIGARKINLTPTTKTCKYVNVAQPKTRPVHIPIEWHERIKIYATRQRMTMGRAIVDVLRHSYLGLPKEKKEQK
jgi:hypothetical protein